MIVPFNLNTWIESDATAQRFFAKVNIHGPIVRPELGQCWLWTAFCDNGYGKFQFRRGTRRAHLWLYKIVVGDVPEGLQLDHLCRNRSCVNPSHLEPVTRSVNVLRGVGPSLARAIQLSKTHCPKGHEYSGNNLFVRTDGRRECRTCMRNRDRAQKAKAKALRQMAERNVGELCRNCGCCPCACPEPVPDRWRQ